MKFILFILNTLRNNPDSKVRGANMGPTWVLSAPDGPHAGPMNLAIREWLTSEEKFTSVSCINIVQFMDTQWP